MQPSARVVGIRPALTSMTSRMNASWVKSSAAAALRVVSLSRRRSGPACATYAASIVQFFPEIRCHRRPVDLACCSSDREIRLRWSLHGRPKCVVAPTSRFWPRHWARGRWPHRYRGIASDSSRWLIPHRAAGEYARHHLADRPYPSSDELPSGPSRMNRVRAALSANPLLVDALIALGLTGYTLFAIAAGPPGPLRLGHSTLPCLSSRSSRWSSAAAFPWRCCSHRRVAGLHSSLSCKRPAPFTRPLASSSRCTPSASGSNAGLRSL